MYIFNPRYVVFILFLLPAIVHADGLSVVVGYNDSRISTLTTDNICQFTTPCLKCNLQKDSSGVCSSGKVCMGGHTHEATEIITDATHRFVADTDIANWNNTDANEVGFTPAGNILATDVQEALEELDTKKAALDGATFTGSITAPVKVVSHSTDQNLTSAQMRRHVYNNKSASGLITYTLTEACHSGDDADSATFYCKSTAGNIKIDPYGAELFEGKVDAGGDSITLICDAIGKYVSILCQENGVWSVMGLNGTLTDSN